VHSFVVIAGVRSRRGEAFGKYPFHKIDNLSPCKGEAFGKYPLGNTDH
jgi:hypothetical protein